jgi:uncharacterized membrane protein
MPYGMVFLFELALYKIVLYNFMMLYIIVALSVIGAFLCAYIYRAKKQNKVLVCAIGTDCNKVIYSQYSTALGVPLEIIGVFYYSALAIVSGLLIFGVRSVLLFDVNFIFTVISAAGAFLSLIFIYVQTILIREWCEYCLVSAGLSLIIFFIKFFG